MGKTIDFTEYKAAYDAEEAAYNAHRIKTGKMTPEEFDALIAKNNVFHGEHLNRKNLDRYQKIKSCLYRLMEIPGAVKASEEAPTPDREEATLHLYVSDAYGSNIKRLQPFIEAIQLADEFTVSVPDDDEMYHSAAAVQLSWTVYDIFEK